jgi:hypothetical protein
MAKAMTQAPWAERLAEVDELKAKAKALRAQGEGDRRN